MKTKSLSKKLTLNKQTVSVLSFENLHSAKGGVVKTLDGFTMCPVFTCGQILCDLTRYPDIYTC